MASVIRFDHSFAVVSVKTNQDNLYKCVDDLIAQKAKETASKTAVMAALGTVAVISILSKIPFIAINEELPFPTPFVWACVVFNINSWFLLECWAMGPDAIDQVRTRSLAEQSLRSNIGLFNKVVVGALIVCLAVASQAPNTFPAIQYNPKEWSVYIAVSVMLALSFFPIKSLIDTAKDIHHYFTVKPETLQMRECFLDLVSVNKAHFIEMSKEKRAIFIGDINAIQGLDDSEKRTQYLAALLSQIPEKTKASNTHCMKALSRITGLFSPISPEKRPLLTLGALTTGLFLMVNYEWFTAEYNYAKTEEYIVDNEGVAFSFSGLVIGTTCYLTGKTIVGLTIKIFHAIADHCAGIAKKNLARQFRETQFLTLQIGNLISSICSVGVYLVVVQDFYEGNPLLQNYFTPIVCACIFLILQTASMAMVGDFMELLIACNGSDAEKAVIDMSNQFQALFNFIKGLDPENLKLFTPLLSEAVKQSLKIEDALDAV